MDGVMSQEEINALLSSGIIEAASPDPERTSDGSGEGCDRRDFQYQPGDGSYDTVLTGEPEGNDLYAGSFLCELERYLRGV